MPDTYAFVCLYPYPPVMYEVTKRTKVKVDPRILELLAAAKQKRIKVLDLCV